MRRHLTKNGKLVTKKIDQPESGDSAPAETDQVAESTADQPETPHAEPDKPAEEAVAQSETTTELESSEGTDKGDSRKEQAPDSDPAKVESVDDSVTAEAEADSTKDAAEAVAVNDNDEVTPEQKEAVEQAPAASPEPESDAKEVVAKEAEVKPQKEPAAEAGDNAPATTAETETPTTEGSTVETASESTDSDSSKEPANAAVKKTKSKKEDAASRRDQRRETRRRRRERLVQSFKDYFDFSDPIGRVPHHRILAINRGERTKVLRVRIECPDWDKLQAETEADVIPDGHPLSDFLRICLQDAMSRLLQPSIEREVRRQLTDRAEEHAVTVFARNLRKLLLQPPLHQKRVVAIDPGFRSGCKLVALDEFGQMLGHTFINLLGKDQQKKSGREALAKFIREHKATVVAVGNGAACRETETLVAEVLGNELKDEDVGYLIVNEAGTSVYSTSELGREELPDVDATVRSAVSIGRRSLDPLSELVKIDPASIGVGLYQHDVKAKHLRESLDDVVESCVNFVGVDVNSASPALLRYVSGLNSLTARKIYEHRLANGPFRNREQLKEVSGVGDASYVQAAGFLKIVDGDTPLDGTWIHPESYDTATKVLDAIGFSADDLRVTIARAPASKVSPAREGDQQQTAAGSAESDSTGEVAGEVSDLKNTAEASLGSAEATVDTVKTEEANCEQGSSAGDSAESVAVAASGSDGGAIAAVAKGEVAVVEAEESAPKADPADGACSTTVEAETESPASTESTGEVVAKSTETPGESSVGTEETVGEKETGEDTPDVTAVVSDRAARLKELTEKVAGVDVEALAAEMGVGKLLLQDILHALARPGRDPREDLPPPIFRTGILKLEDLKAGMELSGTVLNVVDFGAFVDIGLVDSGLIHVSRLADRYVADPHDVVSVGDILRVWVVEVDQKRRRVSLTAIEPGTEKPKPKRGERGGDREQQKRDSKPRRRSRGGGENNERGKSRKFSRGKGQKTREYKPKAKPKPVVPITREMEEGKEPMRTFGDLKQLFDKKKRGGGS